MTTKRSAFGTLSDRAVGDARVRHVWAALPRGTYPGVLLEWRKHGGGWQARVAIAADDEGGLVVRWIPANHLTPVGPPQRPDVRRC
ncbi:MAG: hypothetical protein L0G99_18140 [Propionibacteriales bacterium]|nr:hypothetical protein [Propionibacteriales bacterium]